MAGITIFRSASSATIRALLPPNSSRLFPKRFCTSTATSRPTWQLPVNESSLMRRSEARDWPMSAPPVHKVAIAPEIPRLAKKNFSTSLFHIDGRAAVSPLTNLALENKLWEQLRLMGLWEEVDSDEAPVDKDSDQADDVVECSSEGSDTVQEDDFSDDDRSPVRAPAKIPRAAFYLSKNNTTK
ncbi:hypothetical protein HUJ04_011715 [Dendroctonus ponderosae]|nr:hypothetical protein HUJ04_011715 [Dendroctonus ponderosae]